MYVVYLKIKEQNLNTRIKNEEVLKCKRGFDGYVFIFSKKKTNQPFFSCDWFYVTEDMHKIILFKN